MDIIAESNFSYICGRHGNFCDVMPVKFGRIFGMLFSHADSPENNLETRVVSMGMNI